MNLVLIKTYFELNLINMRIKYCNLTHSKYF